MRRRVGIVDYLNSKPLAWSFLAGTAPSEFEASYHPPAKVADLLAAGDLDVGLIPVFELQRIQGLSVVPGLCVAASKEVRSVLLVATCPFEQIRRVALDVNSRTSAALVKVLLRDQYGIQPETRVARPVLEEMLAESDAALVIGDAALRIDQKNYRVLDLVAGWKQLTGLPFVFAVWAARQDAMSAALVRVLHDSLAEGLAALSDIVAQSAQELHLERSDLDSYLRGNLSFHLGEEELRGLQEFFIRAHRCGLLDSLRELKFVSAGERGADEPSANIGYPIANQDLG